MKVCFQADADMNEIIVKATLRREPDIDFQTAITWEVVRANEISDSRVGSGCVVCKVTTRTGDGPRGLE
jgi:hypothetical protein